MKPCLSFLSRIARAGLSCAVVAFSLLVGPAPANAAGGDVPLDRFPTAKLQDPAALQNGARLFVNYCLNCHSAQLMRYNRLQDIGLTDAQIKDNLLFTGTKVGDTMKIAMAPEDAKSWFGALPPDLSVTGRARASHSGTGADWLYSYLRAYYRDGTRATGWNNAVFPNVGMPHVLWELQGSRGATIEEVKRSEGAFVKTVITFDAQGHRSEKSEKITSGHPHEGSKISLGASSGGKLSQAEFDGQIADLVAYLTYMSDPSARQRVKLGVWVVLFLLFFTVFAWWLNREYWKDVK